MVTYAREEMISVTTLLKTFRQALDKVSTKGVEKIAVMKNNRPEAVLVGVEEYERMRELVDFAERNGLHQILMDRKKTEKESYIPFEEVIEKCD